MSIYTLIDGTSLPIAAVEISMANSAMLSNSL